MVAKGVLTRSMLDKLYNENENSNLKNVGGFV